MYSIQFIHQSGGVSSVSGDTLEQVHARASMHAAYFARSCVIATLPFLCQRSGVGWDATLPTAVKQELGEVLMRLYSQID